MPTNKGDPPRKRDSSERPKDPRGCHDPDNSGGSSGNRGSGALGDPGGRDSGGGRGGGPLNGKVPRGHSNSPGPPGGSPQGGRFRVQLGVVPPTRLPQDKGKVKPPNVFDGNRSKSKEFLNQLHLLFAGEPEQYLTDMSCVTTALSYLKGENVQYWKQGYIDRIRYGYPPTWQEFEY